MKSYLFLKPILLLWRFFVVPGLLVAAFLPALCSAQVYDEQIKSAWHRYMPLYHWGIGWAQIQQESAGRTDAVSPVGAVGLAQFMPRTWEDMKRAGIVPKNANPRDARHAIQAQAYYMGRLSAFWSSPRPNADRLRLALVSYNWGAGNVHESQKKCGNPSGYTAILKCISPRETRDYVPHIERHYRRRFKVEM